MIGEKMVVTMVVVEEVAGAGAVEFTKTVAVGVVVGKRVETIVVVGVVGG